MDQLNFKSSDPEKLLETCTNYMILYESSKLRFKNILNEFIHYYDYVLEKVINDFAFNLDDIDKKNIYYEKYNYFSDKVKMFIISELNVQENDTDKLKKIKEFNRFITHKYFKDLLIKLNILVTSTIMFNVNIKYILSHNEKMKVLNTNNYYKFIDNPIINGNFIYANIKLMSEDSSEPSKIVKEANSSSNDIEILPPKKRFRRSS